MVKAIPADINLLYISAKGAKKSLGQRKKITGRDVPTQAPVSSWREEKRESQQKEEEVEKCPKRRHFWDFCVDM